MTNSGDLAKQPERIEPVSSGFLAQLRGANLGDLVQMECLTLSHRVVQITTAHTVGYLYFSGGQIVHAVANLLTGETAALEILSWDDGTFDHCDREWPKEPSIRCSWQSLVMRASHDRDERIARMSEQPIQVVPFPKSESTPPVMIQSKVNLNVIEGDAELAARLAADGTVVESFGAGGEDFAGIAAYASQLTQLIGSSLGMTGFSDMEFDFKSSKCLIIVSDDGQIIAVKAKPEAVIQKIREKLIPLLYA